MITFDAATKRILLDSAAVTATELYSRSADWLATGDNAKYGAVFRQVGGDDLGAGLSIPPYFFLQGAWRVRPMEVDHDLTITGNLFVEGGGTPVVRTLGPYQVNVNYTVPVQAQGISTSGGSAPTAIENAAAVWARLLADGMPAEDLLTLTARFLLAKATGHPTAPAIRDLADTKNSLTFTLDANGNRVPVLRDPS